MAATPNTLRSRRAWRPSCGRAASLSTSGARPRDDLGREGMKVVEKLGEHVVYCWLRRVEHHAPRWLLRSPPHHMPRKQRCFDVGCAVRAGACRWPAKVGSPGKACRRVAAPLAESSLCRIVSAELSPRWAAFCLLLTRDSGAWLSPVDHLVVAGATLLFHHAGAHASASTISERCAAPPTGGGQLRARPRAAVAPGSRSSPPFSLSDGHVQPFFPAIRLWPGALAWCSAGRGTGRMVVCLIVTQSWLLPGRPGLCIVCAKPSCCICSS